MEFIQHILLLFGTNVFRYFFFAGLAWMIWYVLFRNSFSSRRLRSASIESSQIRREIAYSMSTFLVFTCIGAGIYLLKKNGFTLIYTDIQSYGKVWFALSIVISIFIHDTWFYWSHRIMHHPKLFPHIHLVHHLSKEPSPWASFAFHPFEAVIEAAIIPILVFIMPMHPFAIIAFLLYMTGMNVLGHLGVELFPKGFVSHRIGKWHNTTTHHHMHHKYFKGNYSLYFNFWDRIMKTNQLNYISEFDKITRKDLEIKPVQNTILSNNRHAEI
jgi:sterol desaturase/sphingolipid hydroxylase (fatty acid hydroxylase superfamily)